MSQSSTNSAGSKGTFRGRWQRGRGSRGRGWWRGRGRSQHRNGNTPYGAQNYGQSSNQPNNGAMSMMHDPRPSKPPRTDLLQTRLDIASPYVGWAMYFPGVSYSDHSPLIAKIELFEKYFVSWSKLYNWDDIEQKGFFEVDFQELITDKIIKASYSEIEAELRETPENVLACLGLAMHQIVSHKHQQDAAVVMQELGACEEITTYCAPFIFARVTNFGKALALKNFKANCYGKFVSVKGTVVRVGNIKPFCTEMAFQCASCSFVQVISLPDGKYSVPTKCPADECRGRTFLPCRNNVKTKTIDWQSIRIQEIMADSQKEAGRIPRTVDCELTRDLVDTCVPGDIITLTGIVKVNSVDEGRSKHKDKCMFLLYIHGNSLTNSKGSKKHKMEEASGAPGLAIDFSMKELYAIQEIHSQENLFRLLVTSLCPSIFGHEVVKAGLLLGLFGSGQKFINDKNRIPVRGDPHILVVGDPGLGKSQMLQAVASVAPRSVYVCGNTTTTSGLTVTLSKDGGSGDFALEAGALVLADQGCCCIDEFDKMGSQHQALLEAMEQQSISIAKAGIVCSLPARTSILAAANPVGGHYNKAKTVSENLKMGSALLSRFDLVFIMLDKPDEEMDNALSEHVMALHAGTKSALGSLTAACRANQSNESRLQWERERSLCERLKPAQADAADPIPHQLLRKYVAYARKYVHSKIGPEAGAVIQEFYLSLRKRHQSRDCTPITTRQLESLLRLTEARARLELREVATKEDAEDVVEIMKYSMQDVYSDEFGCIDFLRSQHGSGMSGRSQPKRFVNALQKVSEQTYNNIFTIQQMRQIAKEIGMQIPDLEGFVASLNNQGFLLKKGSKVYQLQTFG